MYKYVDHRLKIDGLFSTGFSSFSPFSGFGEVPNFQSNVEVDIIFTVRTSV